MSAAALSPSGLDRFLPLWPEALGAPEGAFTGVWGVVPEARGRSFLPTEGSTADTGRVAGSTGSLAPGAAARQVLDHS